MKTISRLLLTAALLMACNSIKGQHTMTLDERQQGLSAIAGLEAKGDQENLGKAIHDGLGNGLTVAEIKEALSQLYAYTGFPRSLNALGTLQRVIAERQADGRKTPMGQDDATVLPPHFNSLAVGTDVQTKLGGGKPFSYQFAPRTDYYLKAHLFGDIFAGRVLSQSDREIVTVSGIASLPGCESQLAAHCRGALNMGVTQEQLRSIPAVLEAKVGSAEAWRTRRAIAMTLGEDPSAADPQDPKALGALKGIESSPWPVGSFNAAYAQYFIGKSYLAPLDGENGGPANVTFEPRCRNNWHVHHKGVQVLICVVGRGWYQEWGKKAVEMTPGVVIAIPAEAKHWHGAARDSWFQHITYMTKAQEGASNEWLEPVTDEVYDQLP